MNKIFLWIAMLPSGLWRSMGVDTVQMEAILTARLKMDDRKPLSFGRQRQKKNMRFASALNMFVSFCLGGLYVMTLDSFKETVLGLAGYFTLFLTLLSFTLVTDFSTVLVDTRDKYVLLPRPVNDKTLVFSKLLYVFIYLLRIVLPMSLPGWVYMAYNFGWKSALWFPIPVLLLTFMVLFVVNGMYLLLLRIAKPEKFKEIISYFQIVFSVLIFVIVYLMPRALESPLLQHLDYEKIKSVRFLPSYWLAATWSWIGAPPILGHTQLLGTLAIIVPVICLWITTKFLSPQFARNMGGMDVSEGGPVSNGKKVKQGGIYQKLSQLVNRSDAAKAGFNIAWLQTGRNRAFRMKIYPGFAFVPIYFIFLLIQNKQPLADVWLSLPERPGKMILLLYMSSFTIMTSISYICISDQYKAAWVYYSAPLETPGHVMAGAFKAIWLKYFFPFFFIIAAFALYVWGIKFFPDVLIALVNITLFAAISLRLAYRNFPFSQMEQMKSTGLKTFLRGFSTMLLIGSLGGLHYLTIYFPSLYLLKYIFLLLSAILLWLVWDSYRNTSWAVIKMAEE